MRYFGNSAWMFAEQMMKLISAVFVGVYVARYLGPFEYGVLTYSLAIVAAFMAASKLGMESILVREIAKNPVNVREYMGTAFYLIFFATFGCFLILSAYVIFFEKSSQYQIYIWVISAGYFFQIGYVVDYAYQGKVKAKYSSIAKVLALILSSILKIYLVFIGADLFLFVIAYVVDFFLISFFLGLSWLINDKIFFLSGFQRRLVKPLLESAWPLVLSSVAALLYMRTDQIMINKMLGSYDLGLYSAATRIYEAWIVIPFIISISLLPAIVALKKNKPEIYNYSLVKLFILVFWPGVIVAIVSWCFGSEIINIVFGKAYSAADGVFFIIMWTAPFVALGGMTTRYLTVENMEKKIANRTLLSLGVNIVLNFYLIPLYGIEGAATATLISTLLANYFIDYMDKDLKELRVIKNKALLLGAGSFFSK